MLKIVLSLLTAVVLAGTAARSQTADEGNGGKYRLEKMPRDLEIRFALSALPPHLRDAATVYVLDPARGYVLDHQGSNGFSCIVERTEWARIDFRNDVYNALCYDAEGSKNHLMVYMDTAAMRANGMSAEAVEREIARRFANRTYRAPKRAGLSYMLAPLMRTYPNLDLSDKTVSTHSMPHHMLYAPNLTDRDIGGAKPPSPFPFIFEQGPQGYMIIMLGERESAKTVEDSKELLADLCAYRTVLCLTQEQSGHE